jgi:hypothetical protein
MTNEDVMTANRWFILAVALIGMAPAWSAPPLTAATAAGATGHGGYLVFNQFTVDAERHSVIVPPPDTRAGDLLWIRPLRLNSDEYLVVQKCSSADCATAEVVRAWNAAGIMGWYPILSNKVRIEAGATYIIWMQRIPVKGGRAFSLYERDSPPLVFSPGGARRTFRRRQSQRGSRIGTDAGRELEHRSARLRGDVRGRLRGENGNAASRSLNAL